MRLLSLNVSQPRSVSWRGTTVSTGIFKNPVAGPLDLRSTNLQGDRQADLTVHGGPDKAIYAYAAEHYAAWMSELGRSDLPWGMFGENLTVDGGLREDAVFVGDRFSVGTAEIVAVQPRLPCYKLGIRFGSQRMVKKFAAARRYGVYFRVLTEGSVAVGDRLTKSGESAARISIFDLGRLLLEKTDEPELAARAAAAEFLPERLREHVRSLSGREG